MNWNQFKMSNEIDKGYNKRKVNTRIIREVKDNPLFNKVEVLDDNVKLSFRTDYGFGQILNDMGICGLDIKVKKK